MSEHEVWQEHSSLSGHMSRFPSHSTRKGLCPVQTLSWDLPGDARPPFSSHSLHLVSRDRPHPCHSAVLSTNDSGT